MSRAGDIYGRPWGEKEYIIVLDAYFVFGNKARHSSDDRILRLAKLLNRTPASILMRMENFASLDPKEHSKRKGLANVGPMCRKVFEDWQHRRDHLSSCAEVLARDASAGKLPLFDPIPVAIPKAFEKYELMDFVGEGGFGAVYSCVNIETSQILAIKIIKTDRIYDNEVLSRFAREIRTLKCVEHPNIIRLYEENLEHERHFPAFVMDYADGSLNMYLQEALKKGERSAGRPLLQTDKAADIFRSIVKAVAILHALSPRKVIHRDINPNNILLLPTGEWVLADFGLAKFLGAATVSSSFSTHTGQAWGTPYYAAPEQFRNFKETDERTDVYALGMLLWDLFSEDWPPPDRERPNLPRTLNSVFVRATEREPNHRHKSVFELREEFEEAMRSVS